MQVDEATGTPLLLGGSVQGWYNSSMGSLFPTLTTWRGWAEPRHEWRLGRSVAEAEAPVSAGWRSFGDI